MPKRSYKRVIFSPYRFIWWVELPVWLLCTALLLAWLTGRAPWWYQLVFPTALEMLLMAGVLVPRWFRHRRLVHQYPRLKDGAL